MLSYLNKNLIVKIDDKISKEEIINYLVDLVDEKTNLFKDKEAFLEKINAREAIGTTGIGRGIGVPHARCEQLEDIVFAVALCRRGVEDYNTPDGEEAKVILLVGAPKNRNEEYLKLLSLISRAFRQQEYRDSVMLSGDLDELVEAVATLAD
jgi:mannitol/fructose-specific phosphotransferase system IIA component (Ntr-type)